MFSIIMPIGIEWRVFILIADWLGVLHLWLSCGCDLHRLCVIMHTTNELRTIWAMRTMHTLCTFYVLCELCPMYAMCPIDSLPIDCYYISNRQEITNNIDRVHTLDHIFYCMCSKPFLFVSVALSPQWWLNGVFAYNLCFLLLRHAFANMSCRLT